MDVINFEKAKEQVRKNISEGEINALFLGLFKIMKKSIYQSLESELKSECAMAQDNFKQTLIELQKTQNLLKKERIEKIDLLEKIDKQKQQICKLVRKIKSN